MGKMIKYDLGVWAFKLKEEGPKKKSNTKVERRFDVDRNRIYRKLRSKQYLLIRTISKDGVKVWNFHQ